MKVTLSERVLSIAILIPKGKKQFIAFLRKVHIPWLPGRLEQKYSRKALEQLDIYGQKEVVIEEFGGIGFPIARVTQWLPEFVETTVTYVPKKLRELSCMCYGKELRADNGKALLEKIGELLNVIIDSEIALVSHPVRFPAGTTFLAMVMEIIVLAPDEYDVVSEGDTMIYIRKKH